MCKKSIHYCDAEKKTRQKPKERNGSFRSEGRSGDCLFFYEKWIQAYKKQTAAKSVTAFSFEVVFFGNGDRREDAEGLSQYGAAAEGDQKRSADKPQEKRVTALAQQIDAVCDLQKAAADCFQSLGGKWEKEQQTGQEKDTSCLCERFCQSGKKQKKPADLQ